MSGDRDGERGEFEAALRAGIALYNAGEYHAAHDPWEGAWLPLASGPDERLLHGLIQFTAAVHHARTDNPSGARGLAESAGEYLADLPATYRGVALDPVRAFLDRLAADPDAGADPPPLAHRGERPGPADLDRPAALLAAAAVAEEYDRFAGGVVEDAARYARAEAGTAGARFTALLFDFVADGERRALVYDRLRRHVERRRAEERDVDGLFASGAESDDGNGDGAESDDRNGNGDVSEGGDAADG